jgi:hypothetical protein
MKQESEKYVVNGVGNYQLCVIKENGNHPFIVPLNYICEDKIIKAKDKQFLVLRHAIIEDLDFINFTMNNENKITFQIYANHRIQDVFDDKDYFGKSTFKGFLVYMSLEHDCGGAGTYKIVIELSESNLMYEIK